MDWLSARGPGRIDEDNAASAAVAQRLGMSPFEVVPGALGTMIRYRKTR